MNSMSVYDIILSFTFGSRQTKKKNRAKNKNKRNERRCRRLHGIAAGLVTFFGTKVAPSDDK